MMKRSRIPGSSSQQAPSLSKDAPEGLAHA